MAWLTGWDARKKHHVDSSPDGALSNYNVRLTLHYGSGSDDLENVYTGSRCKTDFGDIRFTLVDGTTELKYFQDPVHTVGSDYAEFWVKIPSLPASDGIDIHVYYDNLEATSTSSGPDTFLFFDDFEDGTLDKWDTSGANGHFSVQTGSVKTGTYALKVDGSTASSGKITAVSGLGKTTGGLLIHQHANMETEGTYQAYIVLQHQLDGTPIYSLTAYSKYWKYYFTTVYQNWPANNRWVDDTWYEMDYAFDFNQMKQYGWNDRASMGSINFKNGSNVNVTDVDAIRIFCTNLDRDFYVDQYWIRNFTLNEPAHSTWYEEEEAPTGTPTEYSGETQRLLTTITDYLAETRRKIQDSIEYLAETQRILTTLGAYDAETRRILSFLQEYDAETKRRMAGEGTYYGETQRKPALLEEYLAETKRLTTILITLQPETLRKLIALGVYDAETLRTLSSIAQYDAETKRGTTLLDEYLAETLRKIITETSAFYPGETLRRISNIISFLGETERATTRETLYIGETVRDIVSNYIYSAESLRQTINAISYDAETKRGLAADTTYQAECFRRLSSLSDYIGETRRYITSTYAYSAETLRLIISTTAYIAETQRIILRLTTATYNAETLRRLTLLTDYIAETLRNISAAPELVDFKVMEMKDLYGSTRKWSVYEFEGIPSPWKKEDKKSNYNSEEMEET